MATPLVKQELAARLSRSLDEWQNWAPPLIDRPTVLKKLPGGLTNDSFLVEGATQTGPLLLVVRLNSPFSKALGIDRAREKNILEAISNQGVAPTVYFNNLEILVTEFLEGSCPVDFKDNINCQAAHLKLLKKIHDIPINLPSFSYLDHCESYWQFLFDRQVDLPVDLAKKKDGMTRLIEQFESAYPDRKLCHHDPGANNLIQTSHGLALIDWEYAALGIPTLDFTAAGHRLDRENPAQQIMDYINTLWKYTKAVLDKAVPV